jgi:hypothetical protein
MPLEKTLQRECILLAEFSLPPCRIDRNSGINPGEVACGIGKGIAQFEVIENDLVLPHHQQIGTELLQKTLPGITGEKPSRHHLPGIRVTGSGQILHLDKTEETALLCG